MPGGELTQQPSLPVTVELGEAPVQPDLKVHQPLVDGGQYARFLLWSGDSGALSVSEQASTRSP